MSIDKCREAFEAWYQYGSFSRDEGDYHDIATRQAWMSWQAAWTARGEHDARERQRAEDAAEALIAAQCDSNGVPLMFSSEVPSDS